MCWLSAFSHQSRRSLLSAQSDGAILSYRATGDGAAARWDVAALTAIAAGYAAYVWRRRS
jgi:hypothetical protein